MIKKEVPTIEEVSTLQQEIEKFKSLTGYSFLTLTHSLREYLEKGTLYKHGINECTFYEGCLDDEKINIQSQNNILKIEITSATFEKQIIRYMGSDSNITIINVTKFDKKAKNIIQKRKVLSKCSDTIVYDFEGNFVEEQITSDILEPLDGSYEGFEPYINLINLIALDNNYILEIDEKHYYNPNLESKILYKKHIKQSGGSSKIQASLDTKTFNSLVKNSAMARRRKKKNTEKLLEG